jgi:hypothetical protein
MMSDNFNSHFLLELSRLVPCNWIAMVVRLYQGFYKVPLLTGMTADIAKIIVPLYMIAGGRL